MTNGIRTSASGLLSPTDALALLRDHDVGCDSDPSGLARYFDGFALHLERASESSTSEMYAESRSERGLWPPCLMGVGPHWRRCISAGQQRGPFFELYVSCFLLITTRPSISCWINVLREGRLGR